MKKTVSAIVLIVLSSAFSLFGGIIPDGKEIDWQLSTGLTFMPGLLYADQWDPGYSGTAFTFLVSGEYEKITISSGLEAGITYAGITLLFPLKGSFLIARGKSLDFSLQAALMPGMIMARPTPYFLFAGEITGELKWHFGSRSSLAFTVGPRYTSSPSYSASVAPYSLLDIVCGVNLVILRD
ncbi:MAG: hypothetical protein JXR86_08130 [Spirochaetales bacterium]|nr:hypothetical protein [Spirochaetales bacterium]